MAVYLLPLRDATRIKVYKKGLRLVFKLREVNRRLIRFQSFLEGCMSLDCLSAKLRDLGVLLGVLQLQFCWDFGP